jgi:hypothetical protein
MLTQSKNSMMRRLSVFAVALSCAFAVAPVGVVAAAASTPTPPATRIVVLPGIQVGAAASQTVTASINLAPSATLVPTATPTPSAEDLSNGPNSGGNVIQGDQIVTGDHFTLRSGETLRGDLTSFGGSVTLEEASGVDGRVTVFGGDADIYGSVRRDLYVMGGSVHLRSSSVVEGSLVVVGGSVQRDPGAVVHSQRQLGGTALPTPITPNRNDSNNTPFSVFFNWLEDLLKIIGSLIVMTLLSVIVLALLPLNVARMAATAQRQALVSGSVGVLTLVVVPILATLLALTLCLIPASILLILALVIAVAVGWAVVARIVGERLAIGFGLRSWSVIAQTVLGAVVLVTLGAVPLVGWLISLLAAALGLGALIMTRFGTRDYPAGPMPPAATLLPEPVTPMS